VRTSNPVMVVVQTSPSPVAPVAPATAVAAPRILTKTGVVRKVDLAAQTIAVMVTRELTFMVTDDTDIAAGEAARALADIRVGDTVTVVYSFTPDRNRVASQVTITGRGPGG